jgi:hypothetical protein
MRTDILISHDDIISWVNRVRPINLNIIGYMGIPPKSYFKVGSRSYGLEKKQKIWMPKKEFILSNSKDISFKYYSSLEYAVELFLYSPKLFFKVANLDEVFLTIAYSPQEALIGAISEKVVTDTLDSEFYKDWYSLSTY